MNQLLKHNESLRNLITSNIETLGNLKNAIDLDTIDTVLRECLSIEEMRDAGSFFTGQALATKAVNALGKIGLTSKVLDPTCGVGNLLIEVTRKLKIKKTLTSTLKFWGSVLYGYDIHESFIEAAKLRIIIEALSRGSKNNCDLEEAMNYLDNIQTRDALLLTEHELTEITHTVMNPPFTVWPSPQEEFWKKGKVNAAGIIFNKYLNILPNNCVISAILPDVLRSGSRYTDFRIAVDGKITGTCDIWGAFNKKTLVDVFLLYGVKNNQNLKKISWFKEESSLQTISDGYDVCVGPLVAYRTPEEGDLHPYFHMRNTLSWETITSISEKRRFTGKVIPSPFILVKRTSSASDRQRVKATIINISEASAIENHMIVIKPKSGKLSDCKALLKVLKSNKTNDFLNDRIRLRHLTVSAIKEIPLA